MATIIPNRTGEAIQRASENLLNMMVQMQRLDLSREEMEQRMEIFNRQQRFAETGRTHEMVMERIRNAPAGVKVADLGLSPEAMQMAGLAYDPETVLTPETTASMIEQAGAAAIRAKGIPENLTERYINRVATGQASSDAMIQLEDLMTETRFEVLSDKFLNMDERTKELFFETTVGLPPSVRFNFGGREYEFESSAAASTAIAFMNYTLSEQRAQQEGRDAMLPYREALLLRMEENGRTSFGVGNARARALSQKILAGDFNDPAAVDAIQNEQERAFVRLQLSAQDLGNDTLFDQWLTQTSSGQAFANFQSALESLEGLPQEEKGHMLRQITDAMAASGVPTPIVERASLFNSNNTLRFPADGVTPESTAPTDPVLLRAIRETVESGEGTREQAIELYGEDVVNQAFTEAPAQGSGRTAQSAGAGGSWGPPTEQSQISDSLRRARQAVVELEAELTQFMAPVANRSQRQQEARRNSQAARRLQRQIDRAKTRVQELEAM